MVRLQVRRGVGDEREARGVGVVDDEVVGQEVVFLLDPEVIGFANSDWFDARHPVPVDLSQHRERPCRCDMVARVEFCKCAPSIDREKRMLSGSRDFATEGSPESMNHPFSAHERREHTPWT